MCPSQYYSLCTQLQATKRSATKDSPASNHEKQAILLQELSPRAAPSSSDTVTTASFLASSPVKTTQAMNADTAGEDCRSGVHLKAHLFLSSHAEGMLGMRTQYQSMLVPDRGSRGRHGQRRRARKSSSSRVTASLRWPLRRWCSVRSSTSADLCQRHRITGKFWEVSVQTCNATVLPWQLWSGNAPGMNADQDRCTALLRVCSFSQCTVSSLTLRYAFWQQAVIRTVQPG